MISVPLQLCDDINSYIEGLGGVVGEFPAISPFTQVSWVGSGRVESRDFLTTSTFPAEAGAL